jgi:penicillin-binding protein 1B
MSGERHQIGSLVKPLAYSIFFDLGKRPNDLVETEEIKLNLKSGEWVPKESHTINEMKVTIENALLKSLNRPVVRLAQELGFENIEKGLDSKIPRLEKPLGEFPAQLLGSSELTMREVMKSYKDVLRHECEVKEQRATVMDVLSNPEESTVGASLDILLKGHKYFGKTGTTNKGKDNWYVFFDGQGIGVFWLGAERFAGAADTNLYGSSTAFKIFQNFYIFRGKRYPVLSCEQLIAKTN